MKWKISILLVILHSLLLQGLFSLSLEEEADLQNLSKSDLIEIILTYDQTLTKIEEETKIQELILSQRKTDLSEREKVLIQREADYIKRENRQGESEAALIVREQLLVESYAIQKERVKSNFWNGFLFGNISGGIAGSITTSIIKNQFN